MGRTDAAAGGRISSRTNPIRPRVDAKAVKSSDLVDASSPVAQCCADQPSGRPKRKCAILAVSHSTFGHAALPCAVAERCAQGRSKTKQYLWKTLGVSSFPRRYRSFAAERWQKGADRRVFEAAQARAGSAGLKHSLVTLKKRYKALFNMCLRNYFKSFSFSGRRGDCSRPLTVPITDGCVPRGHR